MCCLESSLMCILIRNIITKCLEKKTIDKRFIFKNGKFVSIYASVNYLILSWRVNTGHVSDCIIYISLKGLVHVF